MGTRCKHAATIGGSALTVSYTSRCLPPDINHSRKEKANRESMLYENSQLVYVQLPFFMTLTDAWSDQGSISKLNIFTHKKTLM